MRTRLGTNRQREPLTAAHKKKISDALKGRKATRKETLDKALSRAATVAGILQTASFTYDRFNRTRSRLRLDRNRMFTNNARTFLQSSDNARNTVRFLSRNKLY